MTDGERLVWATSYALVFDRSGDAISATRAATHAVEQLRVAALDLKTGDEFLDEIVSTP